MPMQSKIKIQYTKARISPYLLILFLICLYLSVSFGAKKLKKNTIIYELLLAR